MSARLTHAQRNARGKAILEMRRVRAQMDADAGYRCPKCGKVSGDDWSQCGGSCPVAGSPHYDKVTYPPAAEAA